MFDRGGDASELSNVLELVTDAWNYFPHKALGGISPAEKLLEYQEKQNKKYRTYAKAATIPNRTSRAFCSYQLMPVRNRSNSSRTNATNEAKICVSCDRFLTE